jgi:hypothetical protein
MSNRIRRCSIRYLALVLLPLLGCGEEVVAPSDVKATSESIPASVIADSERGGNIGPMCVEGCLDPDPAPSARGYYLAGTVNTPSFCANGSIDRDRDALDDSCEYTLAHTFAPQLSFGYGDIVDREPRWAARWVDASSVGIVYLHSYWQDNGVPGGVICSGFQEKCDPHPGDAEWVFLVVEYDADLRHWYLKDAVLSAHDWHVEMTTTWPDTVPKTVGNHHTGVGFEWPDRVGGYPRIWIADGKHANYPTKRYCDDHGGMFLGVIQKTDQCASPRYTERFSVDFNQNVGSDATRLIDCVTTQNPAHPAYAMQIQECYWSGSRHFYGWFNFSSSTLGSTYGSILRNLGFWGNQ